MKYQAFGATATVRQLKDFLNDIPDNVEINIAGMSDTAILVTDKTLNVDSDSWFHEEDIIDEEGDINEDRVKEMYD